MTSARFLFEASIPGTLYKVDWYPGITLNGNTDIQGEVYELSKSHLRDLDTYEGDEYTRRRVSVLDPDGQKNQVWIYEYNADTKNLQTIPSGNWLEVERRLA